MFALFSAWYFWITKILGLTYNTNLGIIHFWILFAGVNFTFFPQHFLGLQGMPRRISDYADGFTGWNFVSSFGSIISVIATWLFLYILYIQLVKGKPVSRYPINSGEIFKDFPRNILNRAYDSLEWGVQSPPKPHAYVTLPVQNGFPPRPITPPWIAKVQGYCITCYNKNGGIWYPGCKYGVVFNAPAADVEVLSKVVTKGTNCSTCGTYAESVTNSPETFTKLNSPDRIQHESQIDEYMKAHGCDVDKEKRLTQENKHLAQELKRGLNKIIGNDDEGWGGGTLSTPGPSKPTRTNDKFNKNNRNMFVITVITLVICIIIVNPITIWYASTNLFSKLMYLNDMLCNFILDIFDIININNRFEYSDAPRAWGIYFQDCATPQMEALIELHDHLMFYLIIILFAVGWILISITKNFVYNKSLISNKYVNHGTLIELIWTVTPAFILILIAFPSFKLLYLMDEITDPSMSILVEGHQWYWSYQYPDFLNSDDEFIEFDSYLVPESDLEKGELRLLEVDNRVIIPELTHVRFIVHSGDVIHSFACPSLGIKCDAYPGRLNQFSILINREGTFYGQCSEICGILHSSMPIVIESISLEKYLSWLEEQ